MGDVNAGEVKAKVTIEYDGSGVDKAKEDLASLGSAANSAGESAGSAGDSLAQLGEQAGKASGGVAQLSESAASLEKPLQGGVTGITELTDALGEHQTAIEGAGSAYEALAEPIGTTVSMLEEAGPPMLQIAQNAENMGKALEPVNGQIVQIGESFSEGAAVLPQFASSLHEVSAGFDASASGLSDFTENMSVFHEAMATPGNGMWEVIGQHLQDTGQTYSDFASSIGQDNATILGGLADQVIASGNTLHESASGVAEFTAQYNGLGTAAENVTKSINNATGAAGDFTSTIDPAINQFGGIGGMQYAPMNSSTLGINKNGGVGSMMYGPQAPPEAQGIMGGISEIGGGIGDFFGGIVGGLQQIAMPLMAVQMIGMAVGTVATGMYNAAAVAEGPAAHSFGTFTGAVDALSQSSQKAGQAFSESFGQQVIPTLNAISSATGGNNGAMDFLGGWAGGIVDFVTMAGAYVGGTALNGVESLLTGNAATGWGSTLLGVGNSILGIGPTSAQAPLSPAQQWYNQNSPLVGSNVDMLAAQGSVQYQTLLDEANNPNYLRSQDQVAAATAYLQKQQAQFNAAHPISQAQLAADANQQYYESNGTIGAPDYSDIVRGEMTRANGGTYGGGVDPAAIWAQQLLNPGASYQDALNMGYNFGPAGCFPAGTPVLMADGSMRAIEALRIGDRVLAYDGTTQASATVLACIVPPPKQTYELAFDDGKTLTLTDSHPIATTQGWKVLSLARVCEENPDLDVSLLHIGDRVLAYDGLCTLIDIQKRDIVQVYNVTVNGPHTFYVSGILVHNKMLQQGADASGAINKTIPVTVNWDISGELQKTWQSVSSWSLTGDLQKIWQSVSSWSLSGDLEKIWQSVSSWSLTGDLEKIWQSVSSWSLSGELEKIWQSVSSWNLTGELEKDWQAVSSWNLSGDLQKEWHGVASWIGENLEHTFTGVANWVAQNLTPTFNVAASFLGIPGFASGVEGFGGGLAVVGENGPELVVLPSGASVYPQSSPSGTSSVNSGGGMSGGGPQSISVVVHLDGQSIVSALGMPLAQTIRVGTGLRGY